MPGCQQSGVGVVTEILDQRQPRRFVDLQQGRRGKPQSVQVPGNLDKRTDRLAVRWRIHQQQACTAQAEITPARGIRRQRNQLRLGEAGTRQEGCALVLAGWR
ncbi:hypothetical protein D9M68_987400 [compost metagenome]